MNNNDDNLDIASCLSLLLSRLKGGKLEVSGYLRWLWRDFSKAYSSFNFMFGNMLLYVVRSISLSASLLLGPSKVGAQRQANNRTVLTMA